MYQQVAKSAISTWSLLILTLVGVSMGYVQEQSLINCNVYIHKRHLACGVPISDKTSEALWIAGNCLQKPEHPWHCSGIKLTSHILQLVNYTFQVPSSSACVLSKICYIDIIVQPVSANEQTRDQLVPSSVPSRTILCIFPFKNKVAGLGFDSVWQGNWQGTETGITRWIYFWKTGMSTLAV